MPALLQERSKTVSAGEFYTVFARMEGRDNLVDRRVIAMPPAGSTHGKLDIASSTAVYSRARGHGLGRMGFFLRRSPDLVRERDRSFLSYRQVVAAPPPHERFWQIAPGLGVEVVSPDVNPAGTAARLNDFLQAGLRMVWVIDPRRRTPAVHRPGAPGRLLQGENAVDGLDVQPAPDRTGWR